MFKIHPETTWWSPANHTVIDARDIALLGVVKGQSTESYTLHVIFTGSDYNREFFYNNLEELNTALSPLGLTWADEEASA